MTQNGHSRYTGNIENMTQNEHPDTQVTLEHDTERTLQIHRQH